METKPRKTAARLVAAVLLLLSALMLFGPWITVRVNTPTASYTVEDIQERIFMENPYKGGQLDEYLYNSYAGIAEEFAKKNVVISAGRLYDATKTLYSGSYSLKDMAEILSAYAHYTRGQNKYLKAEYGERYHDNGFSRYISIGEAALWLVLVVLLLLLIMAIVGLLRDKKRRIIPFIAAGGVLMLLSAAAVIGGNKALNMHPEEVMIRIGAYFNLAEIDFSVSYGLDFLRVGAASVLCFVLALGSYFAMKYIPDLKIALPAAKPHSADDAEGWRCSLCGRRMGAGDRFCASCGTPRYRKVYCPCCGIQLKNDELFCPQCGSRRPGMEDNEDAAPGTVN